MHRLIWTAIVSAALAGSAWAAEPAVSLTALRCEYLVNPLGIDAPQPRLYWQLRTATRGARQTAYQVLVASTPELLAKDQGDLWDSGKVSSDASTHVCYAGKKLASYQVCHWKVRVWDEHDQPSAFSAPALWSMGILDPALWQGKWLGYTKPYDTPPPDGWRQRAPSPVFRKTFAVPQAIRSATMSICGLGYYVASINGGRVGDHVLDPGYTRYDRRALYVTYDVTDRIRQGRNAIGVMLGNGWYNSHTACVWNFDKAPWRDRPKLLVQLRLVLADGSVQTVVTDESWRAHTGPMVLDGIRNGQVYDARREMPGWDTPDFDDRDWAAAEIVAAPQTTATKLGDGSEPLPKKAEEMPVAIFSRAALRAQMLPPMKVTQTITPVKVTETRPGVWLFDLGQNIAGWAQLRVSGPAGTQIKMVYSERANDDGSIDLRQISKFVKSGPFQTDVYILKGQGEEVWESMFTYHGFRWVEVSGLPGKPTADTLRGRVVHTAFAQIGEFECSNELLNKIQNMTLWSYRGNFHSIPTDCPHREKNGWTGDAQLAAEQAMYNFENTAGYEKWLNDLYDEQRPDGNLPGIVPTSGWGYHWGNGPAWDSAYVLIPWFLYEYRGDRQVLATHYERLKRYVDYLTSRADHDLVKHGLGDWVPAKTKTLEIVTSSGYYYADTLIVAKIAALLGKADEARRYGALAERIRTAYNQALYHGDGVYANGSQTALSCALYQGLGTDEVRPLVAKKLAAAVDAAAVHLDTGILGAKYLLRSLSDTGRHDLAYGIACQTTPPSYGDWVRRGATTLWEDWGDGASRNHIMFGDISAWFYQYLAGIQADPAQPGFKHIIIRPRPVGDLTAVRGKTESLFGPIVSRWRKDKGSFQLDVSIPPNTTATVWVPLVGGVDQVTEGGRRAQDAPGVKLLRVADGCGVFAVESGDYAFVAR